MESSWQDIGDGSVSGERMNAAKMNQICLAFFRVILIDGGSKERERCNRDFQLESRFIVPSSPSLFRGSFAFLGLLDPKTTDTEF